MVFDGERVKAYKSMAYIKTILLFYNYNHYLPNILPPTTNLNILWALVCHPKRLADMPIPSGQIIYCQAINQTSPQGLGFGYIGVATYSSLTENI